MKHLYHTLRRVSFEAIKGSSIQDIAKELIEYRDSTNCVSASVIFNGRYIEIDCRSTLESIISDFYNRKIYHSDFIEVVDEYTSIMRSFQEQCGVGYDFRTIIDNLSDEDICDCFLTWMKENGYKRRDEILMIDAVNKMNKVLSNFPYPEKDKSHENME